MKTRRYKKLRRLRPSKKRAIRLRRRRRTVSRRPYRSPRAVAKANAASSAPSFASMDFPGREVLCPFEIAKRLGCCTRHVQDLIQEGQLRAVDISRRNTNTDRKTIRVPIESWRQFLSERTI